MKIIPIQIGEKNNVIPRVPNCSTNKSGFPFPLFLKLLKQKTINSLMILQNMFTSGKLLGNMGTTGVD